MLHKGPARNSTAFGQVSNQKTSTEMWPGYAGWGALGVSGMGFKGRQLIRAEDAWVGQVQDRGPGMVTCGVCKMHEYIWVNG
jgi:hypothetical protein